MMRFTHYLDSSTFGNSRTAESSTCKCSWYPILAKWRIWVKEMGFMVWSYEGGRQLPCPSCTWLRWLGWEQESSHGW
jgi:hypothetical protein